MVIRFTANVVPHGKQRARTVMRGGYAHSYTPRETVDFERAVGMACQAACKGVQMPENAPLMVGMVFYMPIPKSTPKRLRKRMEQTENVFHTRKPDTDNCAKSILDSIRGIAYKDDNQVAVMQATKVYSANPRVKVTISTI